MKNSLLLTRVAGLFIAGALLAGCYAPITNQKGYINLGIQSVALGPAGTTEVIVLVVNSGFKASLAEMLNLVSKSKQFGGLSQTDKDRLKTLAKDLATNGLVKFGGFPFYQTTLNGNSGSFDMPGIPEGRGYFVKLFVFNPNVSFTADDFGQHFWSLIQLENLVFSPEVYTTDTAWQGWVPAAGQPVEVKAGQAVDVNVTLVSPP
jgi:hypothetical protein